MLKIQALQRVAAVVRLARMVVKLFAQASWRAARWIAGALIWATRRISGAVRSIGEPSPVAMLTGYAALLCVTVVYGVASTTHTPSTAHLAPVGATTPNWPLRVATLAEPPLRAYVREIQEQQHLQPLLDAAIARPATKKAEAPVQPLAAPRKPETAGQPASASTSVSAQASAQSTTASNKPAPAQAAIEKPAPQQLAKQECTRSSFGPGRVITLDTQGGGEYGMVQFKNTLPLSDREVVFTFDDGPHPVRTPQILDILDRYCVKAVFFMIGEMAERSPELVREIKRRGHTIGTHTYSHPLSLAFMQQQRAEDQIQRGFAAVANAAGEPISPFFRFPGLGQSKRLLEYLARQDMAVWSVDVVSGDSERASAGRLPRLVMSRLDKHGRGILLFHDIKKSTVEALPVIIENLREEGYRAAQVVPATPLSPDPALIARLNERKQAMMMRQGRAKIR